MTTVDEIAACVRRGEVSAVEVATAALGDIADRDGLLRSCTDVLEERALGDARRVDAAVAAGEDPGPLAGVPFAVKNLFEVEGIATRAGSRIELDRGPARVDAAAVARLRLAGAVLVATTNTDEYAHGLTTENTHYGTTRNPHDPERIAGGSSGGSAAAVAAGLVPFTLGSDTNGSVRVPASLCGTFGLKPTFGRVSRAGTVPFVGSLDHVGPFAGTAAGLASVYDVLVDGGGLPAGAQRAGAAAPARGIDGLRMAVASGHFLRVADKDARAAVEQVAGVLGIDRQLTVAGSDAACAAAHVITAAEGAQRHARALRSRPRDFDPRVRPGLMAGLLLPAEAYLDARRFRRWYREVAAKAFADVDVLITATTPCAAPRIGEERMAVAGEEHLVGMSLGLLTQPWSLVGFPALSVPARGAGRLPLGVQLVAAPGRDAVLLRVAAALEEAGVLATTPVAHR